MKNITHLNGWLQKAALTTVFIISVCSVATARPISRQQAQQHATAFMQQRGDSHRLSIVDVKRSGADRSAANAEAATLTWHTGIRPVRKAAAQQATQAEPYFVFDRGQNEGFVIISGDDQTVEQVLGYCDSGTFDYDQLPPNMREWLDGYALQIAKMQEKGSEEGNGGSMAPVRRLPAHPAIATMMSSKWNQGSPYNNECPMYFTLGRSVTGCVATAYAQILYYQREKMVTETQAAMPAYTGYTAHETYGNLQVAGIPKGSPIDWDNMRDTYNGSETAVQKTAVAQLMHYCGVGVKMDYTNSASGAQSQEVYNALRNYFGFGNSVRYVSYQNYTTDEQWDEVCYQELAEGRPFYISGANADVGHAFVCDGYDGARRYHINWGWGGQSDGHYYLSDLNPGQQGIGGSNDGYNQYRECIMGIEPENYADRKIGFSDATVRQLCTEAFDQNGDGILTYGEAAQVKELGTVMKGTAIKTFTELHYFTSLTKLGDDAFSECEQLTTIQLPRQITEIGSHTFMGCKKLQGINMPEGLQAIGDGTFAGCESLKSIELPSQITDIQDNVFFQCSSLAELTLPIGIRHIGTNALANCTSLEHLYVKTMQPEKITLGNDAFEGIGSQCTLHVMQGTLGYYQENEQWNAFSATKEERELSRGVFAPFATGQTFYLYHVGTGRYLTKGEAWGTQAIVGNDKPMRFVFNRSGSMPEGTYYLTSEDTERTGKFLFRTSTDGNVGQGVQAAFVDGGNLTNTAHWLLTDVGDNTYTLSIPSGYANYNSNCRWGVQTSHASNAASPTWGVYSDIVYQGHEQQCQWRLVAYDADQTANFEAAKVLQNLIELAQAKHLNTTQEQAVLDNLESTTDELLAAQQSLRKKLKLMIFADNGVRQMCVSNFDIDGDGELSLKEASVVDDLGTLFQNSTITEFDELQYFTSLTYIAGTAFSGCRQLTSIVLPASVEYVYYYAFRNCSKLTSITLPDHVSTLGANAFEGCTSLQTLTVLNPEPATISMGSSIFNGVTIKNVTLQVPAGAKELYAEAPVWKNFGNIIEVRAKTQPRFSPISEGATGYVYNVATRKYLAKGEAYGTQSVVSQKGMLYTWMRTKSMADGQYYLHSTQTGQDGKILFRTNSDTKVGGGVKACFVDGSLSARAYWQVDSVAELTYTLQVPANDATYVEGEYLGIDIYHQSGAASPTNGTYWDIAAGTASQWRFISQEDMEAAQKLDADIEVLKALLQTCADRQIDKEQEQAVYDNLQSTAEEIADAILSLREKLHYINFADNRAKTICLEAWDGDADGELTYEEAALVTNIGETFRNQSQLKNLEALRYFTSLEEIPENAFRNSSALSTVYVPASVKSLGKSVFTGCSSLKYLVVLNPQLVVPAEGSNVPATATVFVPETLTDAYLADEQWGTHHVTAYTGQPTVSALPTSRLYGRTVAILKYEVTGAPIDGEPELTCEELGVSTTPVGEYTIHIDLGTITTRNVQLMPGVFSVTPAQLTITAKSYTRNQGEPNPEFEVTYKGFRNRETAEVLLSQPVISCEATQDSPAGEYDIFVSGAQAENYEITYVPGVLTIIADPTGILSPLTSQRTTLYDLQGRRVKNPSRQGLYINGQRKKVLKRK